MATMKFAEYIWLDGAVPTRRLRSKARVIRVDGTPSLDMFPRWNFDGSSTYQSPGRSSDLLLEPAFFCADPIRGDGNFLVLCEVLNPDGTPHLSNSRAALRAALEAGGAEQEPWAGFEQEYTLFQDGRPLGFPQNGFPAPQGPYYCSVGHDTNFGRPLVERHAKACLDAGLSIYGINAEVMPGQWEFQIGYRGVASEDSGVLNMSDHLWVARWLLYRLGEEFGMTPSFDCKPMLGDWNGAGCHTNLSTKATRGEGGREAINDAIIKLEAKHKEHIKVYGTGLELRLTGAHETCNINQFKAGVADRGSSIRIPVNVVAEGRGYLEDRRPGANMDPYLVSARLVKTICELDEECFEMGDWSLDKILSAAH